MSNRLCPEKQPTAADLFQSFCDARLAYLKLYTDAGENSDVALKHAEKTFNRKIAPLIETIQQRCRDGGISKSLMSYEFLNLMESIRNGTHPDFSILQHDERPVAAGSGRSVIHMYFKVGITVSREEDSSRDYVSVAPQKAMTADHTFVYLALNASRLLERLKELYETGSQKFKEVIAQLQLEGGNDNETPTPVVRLAPVAQTEKEMTVPVVYRNQRTCAPLVAPLVTIATNAVATQHLP